ncbi:hypothetical protein BOX15_Mlig018061g1 [Macrostomum lignano]|uniref:VWFA domain-containing protein n=1 Tax=Macrostomum lignano TaxID=282301 RepID=A0A267FB75_9PLAT|nr:hypothetical protein BOX15_Mlig018061g1 [Macrostomum lignano]
MLRRQAARRAEDEAAEPDDLFEEEDEEEEEEEEDDEEEDDASWCRHQRQKKPTPGEKPEPGLMRVALDRGERSSGQEQQAMLEALNMFLMRNTNAKYEGEKLLRDDVQGAARWRPVPTANSVPPHELMVTQIDQTHDLLRVSGLEVGAAEQQSTQEWLQRHSVEALRLTVKDLVQLGKLTKPKPDAETGKPMPHLQFDAADVIQFEYRLHQAVQAYTERIKWCLRGSRKLFGLVQGERVAVCVDCSDANMSFGRAETLQQALLHLIDEQLSSKQSVYMMSFGTELQLLWPNVMDVNCRTLEEAKMFAMTRQAAGGCNLLKALRHLSRLRGVDSILIVVGSTPDQPADILEDFALQLSAGRDLRLHTVAFDCASQISNSGLRRLAEVTGGRFHCYSATSDELIYASSDISGLLQEIDTTQEVLKKIGEMRQGMLDSTLVSIMNEISMEVDKLPQSRFLPRPPGHDEPLKVEPAKFQPASSIDWLMENGLKANKMDLYQILAPNAYSYCEGFVPIIRKTVQSQVHEKVMAQFPWHDGSVKNVHVDLAQLFEYQKQLGHLVKLYEQRINWLASSSRKIFGTIVERNMLFLLDMSAANVNYLVHIQHSMRMLMEQQMSNKDYFNLVAFGSEVRFFSKTMVKVSEASLQAGWKWILGLECAGSRNLLGALRKVLENEEEEKHRVYPEGLYLFTSGIPDQGAEQVSAYLEEKAVGRDLRLHCVLFNVDDYDKDGAIPGRYASITKTADSLRFLAHCTGGRFHWFRETGIIESDDIRLIMSEIDKAVNFSRRAKTLIDAVRSKYEEMFPDKYPKALGGGSGPESGGDDDPDGGSGGDGGGGGGGGAKPKALPPPKPTAKSLARQSFVRDALDSEPPVPKALGLRPGAASSVKAEPLESVRLNRRCVKSAFYTGERNRKGQVISDYQGGKSVRKAVGRAEIPDKEDQVTSKAWFKRYSLAKLGLDLYRLVSGPDCRHEEKLVKPLGKTVSAKYCSGLFPTVNVRGVTKHLQYTPVELQSYDAECVRALKRYLQRLHWLLSGSRRLFGVVVETRAVFLVDVSGSMAPYMEELKLALKALVWEQLYKFRVAFNLIAFSSGLRAWSPGLEPAEEDSCHAAVAWIDRLESMGNTATLEALEAAFATKEPVDAIYLLTDGKPDTSTSTILRSINRLDAGRNIAIHTISFNCCDATANNFLQCLASETGGRYHKVVEEFDAKLFAHRLLEESQLDDPEYPNLPAFEGDDLSRLAKEIDSARRFLAKSKYFKDLYYETKRLRTENLGARENRMVPA